MRAMTSLCKEGVFDADPVDLPTMPDILCKENAGATLDGGIEDGAIPESVTMARLEINGAQDRVTIVVHQLPFQHGLNRRARSCRVSLSPIFLAATARTPKAPEC